jgi:hypothetical protein
MSVRVDNAIARWPKVEVKNDSELAADRKSSPNEVVFAAAEPRLGQMNLKSMQKQCCELQHSRVGEIPQRLEFASLSAKSGTFNSLNKNDLIGQCDGRGLVPVVLSHSTSSRIHHLVFGLARREDAKQ